MKGKSYDHLYEHLDVPELKKVRNKLVIRRDEYWIKAQKEHLKAENDFNDTCDRIISINNVIAKKKLGGYPNNEDGN